MGYVAISQSMLAIQVFDRKRCVAGRTRRVKRIGIGRENIREEEKKRKKRKKRNEKIR